MTHIMTDLITACALWFVAGLFCGWMICHKGDKK